MTRKIPTLPPTPTAVARQFQGRRADSARREALLDALLVLVLEQGFSAITMDTFASHARCSKTTIYTLGVDKEQLVATLYRRFFREATATIEERIAPIATERERIATYLDAIGSHMSRMSNACYIDMTQHDATLEIYGTNARVSAERVRLFIERGISTGEFGGTNARFIGEAVWLLIEGIHHGVLLDRTHLTSGQAYREISELVLKALTNTART